MKYTVEDNGDVVFIFPQEERALAEYVLLSIMKVSRNECHCELRKLYDVIRVTHEKEEEN